ncbi:MAG: TaqI-like C-terminal specificity domain-containing protein [Sulfurimonas sp.]|jgi:adenine-specific DNA-methyltransferase
MELKQFLQSAFNKQSFIQFISERFYGFASNLKENEYLGKVKLDDKSEIGFFVFEVKENKDIANSRVGFHKELKTYADEHMLDGAIGAFYHPLQHIWRLSFIRFSYDETHKKETTSQKRFTFLLGNEKIKTALEQLKNLKYPKISELEKAFSVESVTKEFYKGLVKEYNNLLDKYMTYPTQNDNDKKEFAIRLIGRILFIKFLNKKALIPDDIFSTCQEYYHEKLEPLFFEQLNTQKSERKKEFANDSIPFLNGGLFEPLHLDYYEYSGVSSKYINMLKVDDNFFTELYEHLNQFNFTIDENSIEDSDLSIDPEMLGRIFENLLAEINPETSQNARKSTGSYYTPREIVEYMVNSSLLEHIKTKTDMDEEVLKTIIFKNQEPSHDYDKTKILSAIFELKILDPACGSGAFPMGLLQKIVKILELIDEDATIWFNLQSKEFKDAHKNRNKNYIRKLSIIKNTIYGIDIQPIAIEISKLRFFLSLVVDEDGEPEPLPNLEFKFVCANSLLPKPKNNQLATLEYFMLEGDLLNLKNEYFEASGERKKEIKKEYMQTQKKMFEEEEATNLLSALENKLTDYNPFDPLSVAGFFDSDFMFNIKDGFDIVIGNPPYIGEKGSKNLFDTLRHLKHYERKMDIFYFFFHTGLDNLKNGGILSLITTNYYITATGAVKVRNDFKERSTILNLINFNELKIFESALGQHNLITTLQKGKFDKPAHTSIVNAKGYLGTEVLQSIVEGKNKDTNYYQIPQEKLFNGGNIQLTIGGIDNVLDKIKIASNELGLLFDINSGVETGADKVTANIVKKYKGKKFYDNNNSFEYDIGKGIYILSQQELDALKLQPNEYNLIKRWYKSSDIDKYSYKINNNESLIYIDSKININQYPNIYKHLSYFRHLLNSREQANNDENNWFWIRGSKRQFFERKKYIICKYRAYQNIFAYSDGDFYSSRDVYYVTYKQKRTNLDLKFILAILNSKLIYKWLYYRGKRKGEMLELYQEPLSKIPIIKDISLDAQNIFILIVDYIIFLKQQEFNQNDDLKFAKDRLMVSFFERLIDCMVYELYFADELHKENKYFIEPLQKESLIDVQNMDNKLEEIRAIFEKLNDKNHTIKKNMYFIDSVEVVRIIEGKDNENN